jgi:hypothetical protein
MKKVQRSGVIDTYSSMTPPPCEGIETGVLTSMSSLRMSEQKTSRGNPITLSLGNGVVLPRFASIVIVALMIRQEEVVP